MAPPLDDFDLDVRVGAAPAHDPFAAFPPTTEGNCTDSHMATCGRACTGFSDCCPPLN